MNDCIGTLYSDCDRHFCVSYLLTWHRLRTTGGYMIVVRVDLTRERIHRACRYTDDCGSSASKIMRISQSKKDVDKCN